MKIIHVTMVVIGTVFASEALAQSTGVFKTSEGGIITLNGSRAVVEKYFDKEYVSGKRSVSFRKLKGMYGGEYQIGPWECVPKGPNWTCQCQGTYFVSLTKISSLPSPVRAKVSKKVTEKVRKKRKKTTTLTNRKVNRS